LGSGDPLSQPYVDHRLADVPDYQLLTLRP
jgi:hypothetical protein